ncbi:hypothetical protein [Flavobacterium pedocola]
MKLRLVIFIVILFSAKSFSQKTIETYKLENKTLVARISENSKIDFILDKNILLNTVNEQLNESFKSFDEIDIKSGTHNQENFKYYYLELKSKVSNQTLVKWLSNRNNKLYYEDSEDAKYSSLNFFVICEGNENCYPRLFFDGDKYFWTCRETPICVTKEESIKNPCKQTTGFF